MKKPAAARKKMKKRSACIKRPSSVARVKAWRENAARNKSKGKKENVLANARRAARNGLPYQTKSPKYVEVAAAAYTAAAYAKERADCAHERAGKAQAAADSALEAAKKAKEDAGDANKRITCLAGEVKWTQALAKRNEERYTSLADKVKSTAALANWNKERLDTDDRKRGYVTP